MDTNLSIWDAVFATDPAHTKGFKRTGGFSGTAIKPLYLIHKATSLWGAMGDKWGAESSEYVIHGDTVFIRARLWYPGTDGKAWVEHWGGDVLVKGEKATPNDEAFKMAFTDAVGKCLVQLGFSADVHMGLFDDNKYVQERRAESDGDARKKVYGTATAAKSKAKAIEADLIAAGADSLDAVARVWKDNAAHIKAIASGEGGAEWLDTITRVKERAKRIAQDRAAEMAAYGEGFVNTPTGAAQ